MKEISELKNQWRKLWVLKDADRRLPVPERFLPLNRKTHKPKEMSIRWRVGDLVRKALGAIQLSLASTVAFNVSREKTTKDLMAAQSKMYEKPSASNKVFLMKKLFNLKMADSGSVAWVSQRIQHTDEPVGIGWINFEYEIKVLEFCYLVCQRLRWSRDGDE